MVSNAMIMVRLDRRQGEGRSSGGSFKPQDICVYLCQQIGLQQIGLRLTDQHQVFAFQKGLARTPQPSVPVSAAEIEITGTCPHKTQGRWWQTRGFKLSIAIPTQRKIPPGESDIPDSNLITWMLRGLVDASCFPACTCNRLSSAGDQIQFGMHNWSATRILPLLSLPASLDHICSGYWLFYRMLWTVGMYHTKRGTSQIKGECL